MKLPYETEYRLGLLPEAYSKKGKKTVPFHELPRGQLTGLTNWYLEHAPDSAFCKALVREQERRHLNLSVPAEHPKPPTLPCPECEDHMVLRPSKYGLFYGCASYPKCKATHGAHSDGRPLGIPATKEVKEARMRAHAAFDVLWKGKEETPPKMKRKEAYRWLPGAMNLPKEEAHIGRFDKEQCEKLIQLVQAVMIGTMEVSHEADPH